MSRESGLFSTLSSYLSNYATDEPSPPSDEEIERTMCTVDCIKSCNLEEVSRNLMFTSNFDCTNDRKLSPQASKALMTALLQSITIDASEDYVEPSGASSPRDALIPLNGHESQGKDYDPSMLFVLELAVSLAIRDEQSMKDLSSEVATHCTEILRQRRQFHPILVERTMTYLLALKTRGHQTVSLLMSAS
jgi:golgi-specific brefeldin A-resistance guanine nucleotide exchange factor 1